MDRKVIDQNHQPLTLRRSKLQPNILASLDEAVPPEPALFPHMAANQPQPSPTRENALGFGASSSRPLSPPELSPRSQMAKATDELQEVINEARVVNAQAQAVREKIRNAKMGLGCHRERRIPRPPESTVIEEVARPLSQNSSYRKLPPISSRTSSDTSSCLAILPPIRSRSDSATSFCSEVLPPITSQRESTMSDETLEGSGTPEGRKMADISSVQAECRPHSPEAESSATSLVTTPCPSSLMEEYHILEALCHTDRTFVKKFLKMKHVSRALFGSHALEIVNWITTVSSTFVLPAMVHYQTTTEGLSLTLPSSVSHDNPLLQSLRQIVDFCVRVSKLEDRRSPQTSTTGLFLTGLEGENSLRLSDIEEQEEERQTARSTCSIGHSSSRSTKAVVDPLSTSAHHVLEVVRRGQAETSGDQQAVLFRETILLVHQRLSDTGPAPGPAHEKMGHLLHLFHHAAVQSSLITALAMAEQTDRTTDGDHRRGKDDSHSSFSPSSSSSCEESPMRRAAPGEAWGMVGSSGFSPVGSRWSPVSALSLREQRQALEVLTRVLTAKVEDTLEDMCEDPEKVWDTVLRGCCLAFMNNTSDDVTIREEEPSTSLAPGIYLDQSPAKATSSHSLSLPVQPAGTGDAAATHRAETETASDEESDEDEVENEEEETVAHQAPHSFIVLPDSYKDSPLNDDITASDSNSDAIESPGASVVPCDQENASGIPQLYTCGGKDVDSTDIDEDNPMTPTEWDRELRSQSPFSSSEEEVQIRKELLLDVPRATAMRRLTLKNVIHGVMTALSTGGALRPTSEEDHLETEKVLLKKVRLLLKRNAGISVTCNKQEVSGHFKSFAAVNGMIQSASKELLSDWNATQLHPTRRGVAETLARVILEQGGRCVIPHDYYGPCDLEDDLEEDEEEERHWYDSFWKSPRPPTELDMRYGLIQFSQGCSSSTPARNTPIRGSVNCLAGLAKPSRITVSLKDGESCTKHDTTAIKVAPSSKVSIGHSGHTSTLSSGSLKKAQNSSQRPSQERASLGFSGGVDCLDTEMIQRTNGQVSGMKSSSKTKKKKMVPFVEEGKGKRQKNRKNNAELLSSAHAATKEEEVQPKIKPTLHQRFKSARKSFRLTLARIFCCGPPM